MRYSEERHGTPEAFARSRDGEQYVREVRHTLAGLRDFALTHPRHLDAGLVCEALQQLEDKITHVEADGQSLLGPRAGCIYNAGKALLDDIGVAMRDERVPLTTRLGALRVLAENATPCVDGMLSQLNHCLSAVNGTHSPLLGLALKLSADLLDEAIVQALRQHNVHTDPLYPANEIHHVNGLKAAIFPAMGRSVPSDRIAVRPDPPLIATCERHIELAHRPSTLALAIADRIRTRFEADLSEQLGLPIAVLHRGFALEAPARRTVDDIALVMKPEFGELPLDTLMDWQDGEQGALKARLHRGGMLLARHVLSELHRMGMVQDEGMVAVMCTLNGSAPGAPGAALHLLDEQLFWVEAQGSRRGLSVEDLLTQPLRGVLQDPQGLVHFEVTNRRLLSVSLHDQALFNNAAGNAWPSDLMAIPAEKVYSRGFARALVGAMEDDILQTWLTREGPGFSAEQRYQWQEALVEQRRAALLQVPCVQAWCNLGLELLSPRLWQLAMPSGDADLLGTVGDLMLHAAHRLHACWRSSAAARLWLERSFGIVSGHSHPLESLFSGHKAMMVQRAADVILTAHEQHLLDREQLLRILSVGPFLKAEALHCPGCSVLEFADMLDAADARVGLAGEDLVACIGEGASNPAFAVEFRHGASPPSILMLRFNRWALEGRLDMAQWWRLMTFPPPSGDGSPPQFVASRLSRAPGSVTRHYLEAVTEMAWQGKLAKARLLHLLRGPAAPGAALNGVPDHSQPTLIVVLTSPWRWPSISEASDRIAAFFNALVLLTHSGHLAKEDVLLILLEQDRVARPSWSYIHRLASEHPCRSAVLHGLGQLEGAGVLTAGEVHQMLHSALPTGPGLPP